MHKLLRNNNMKCILSHLKNQLKVGTTEFFGIKKKTLNIQGVCKLFEQRE